MKSSYYPPRARLPAFGLNAWFEFRRALRLERLQAPGGISPLQILTSLVIPGWAFIATWRRHLGMIIVAAYLVAGLAFFAFLGSVIASVVFGLMIAAHTISILWILRLWIDQPPFWLKIGMAGTLLMLLGMAFYWPPIRYMEDHWFMPLSTHRGPIVIQRDIPPERVQTGEAIAYRIGGLGYARTRIADGFSIERVLATGGDRIEFTPGAMIVNGQPRERRSGMPSEGKLIVPKYGWFVWPDVDIRVNGEAGEALLTNALLRLANVSHSDYIGKPYKTWFGRSQKLP